MISLSVIQGTRLLLCGIFVLFNATPTTAQNLVPSVDSDTIRIATLNLHGYHAYQQDQRYIESKNGTRVLAPSHPFYFTESELAEGNLRRLDGLAQSISRILPDVMLFQEVGAGWKGQNNDCNKFSSSPNRDQRDANTVHRLALRLESYGYTSLVACRGNIGWKTDRTIFQQQRVLARDSKGRFRIVHDFESNPYPDGLLVEGFGMLVRKSLTIESHAMISLPFNELGETISLQWAEVRPVARPQDLWILVNIHGGHKIAHFEQSLAIRKWLSSALMRRRQLHGQGRNLHLIVAGDFNALIYGQDEQNTVNEMSMLPWLVRMPRYFDFSLHAPHSEQEMKLKLKDQLFWLNSRRDYKPWATIENPKLAQSRINSAVEEFFNWQNSVRDQRVELWPIWYNEPTNPPCNPSQREAGSCDHGGRIDHILYSPASAAPRSSQVIYSDASWESTDSYSDHPGILAEFAPIR